MSLLTSLTFSSLLLSHTLAASFLAPKHPKTPAQLEKQNPRDEDYKTLPWDDLAENEFFPRHSFLSSNPQEAIPQNPNPAPTTYPTKTLPNRRPPLRDQSTSICSSSVQCTDGGCCEVGGYCAIREGVPGCCPLGSACDAVQIPGCKTSCFGSCCDVNSGGQSTATCSPIPGAQGQASGICMGYTPPEATGGVTPPSPQAQAQVELCNSFQEFTCGQSCCPLISGIICDNTTIPSTPFCNTAARICPPTHVHKRTVAETYDQYANGIASSAIADASAFAASAVSAGSAVAASAVAALPSACLATIETAVLTTRVYASGNAATVGVSNGGGGAGVTSAAKMTVLSVFSAVPKSYFVEVPVLKVPNPNHVTPTP